jgi:hypothetical protein
MALLAELLYARLTANAGLAALVGNRVHPDMMPQNAVYPALRYVLVSRVEVVRKPVATGGVGASLAIVRARVQVDVYAKTYRQAHQVATAVRGAVYGWVDPTNGVIGARVTDEQDVNDGEETMQRVSLDLSVTYNE